MWVEVLDTHGILHLNTSDFLFSLEDLPLIQSRNSWYEDKNGYLVCSYYYYGRLQVSRFHRLVMKAKTGQFVDHINKNKRDNRRENLRCCSFKENDRNRGIYSTNTSGVTGVFFDKYRDRWYASISFNCKRIFIGRYKSKEDAVRARLNKEIELFGEYAPQKVLWEKYQGEEELYE